MATENIYPIFDRLLTRLEREERLHQKAKVFWFTGLSGAGKSTIAQGVERKLFDAGFFSQVLDGDNIRIGINKNLGFSQEDRKENIRRIAEVAKLYAQSGIIVLCSFISPTKDIRQMAKNIIGEDDFLEIFIDASLEVCESRDVKGLYAKARRGEIKDFTGIGSPYEVPENPFLNVPTTRQNIEDSVCLVFEKIKEKTNKNGKL